MAINLNLKRRKRRINADINITPLVDVMLVLLVIFMITAPMLVAGIAVNLPAASATPIADNRDPIVLSLDKIGQLYLMDKVVDELTVIDKLKAVTTQNYQTPIFLKGDKDLAYGKVVKIIAKINQAGFNKVILITKVQDEK